MYSLAVCVVWCRNNVVFSCLCTRWLSVWSYVVIMLSLVSLYSLAVCVVWCRNNVVFSCLFTRWLSVWSDVLIMLSLVVCVLVGCLCGLWQSVQATQQPQPTPPPPLINLASSKPATVLSNPKNTELVITNDKCSLKAPHIKGCLKV